jgi:hypothetical protein
VAVDPVGDPIWPEPQQVILSRLLDGALLIRGYPLEMVLAEKIVTAIARGSANTRWRDFVDIYSLVHRHTTVAATLRTSLDRVAQYRRLSQRRCFLHLQVTRSSVSNGGWRG